MDVDEESIKSESTLTSMSCTEDTSYSKSTTARTHSSLSNPRANGVTYQLSRDKAERRQLRSLWLSQATYGKLKQGNRVEFFDKHSLAYMIVCIRYNDSSSRKGSVMHEDAKRDEDRTTNAIQFAAKPHDGHRKGKHRRTKKTQQRKKRSAVSKIQESATTDNRYDINSLDSNSIVWCREDNRNGKRLKQWIRDTRNLMDQNMTIKVAGSKRKLEMSSFDDQLIVKKRISCQCDNERGCNMVCRKVNMFSKSVVTGMKSCVC